MKDYDFKNYDFNDGFASVCLNNKWGFVDENGDEICEIKYDYVWYFENEFAYVRIGNKHGYINRQGIEVVECKYKYKQACVLLEKYNSNKH